MDGVLVAPEAAAEVGDLAGHVEALGDRSRDVDADHDHRRVGRFPGEDRRLLLEEGPGQRQGVVGGGADGDPAIGGVVERVVRGGVVAGDVLPLGEVEGAGVGGRVDVPPSPPSPAGRRRWTRRPACRGTGRRWWCVHLRPLAQRPAAVEARDVGVGAADAELVAAGRRRGAGLPGGAEQLAVLELVEVNPCFSQLRPIWSKRPFLSRYRFWAIAGWSAMPAPGAQPLPWSHQLSGTSLRLRSGCRSSSRRSHPRTRSCRCR